VALSVKRGSFASNTASATQAVTGVGFQPKAVIFLSARVTAADGIANAALIGSFGIATDALEGWAISSAADDAAPTMNTARRHDNTRCITFLTDGAPTLDASASFASADSDGFTLTWDAAPNAAYVVEYLALGGSDLTGVDAGEFTLSGSAGNASVTGVGFQPKLLFFGSVGTNAVLPAQAGVATIGLGAAVSASQRGAYGFSQNDGVTTENATITGNASRAFTAPGITSLDWAGDLVSMDADGFTYNLVNTGGLDKVSYLALGGTFQAAVVADAQKTSTGNQAKTGVGFAPKALLGLSQGRTPLAVGTVSTTDDVSFNVGVADGAGQESSMSLTTQDAAGTSVSKRSHSQTKFMRFRQASNSTVLAECDVVSLDADGYTLGWTTADAVARELIVIAFGDAAVTDVPKSGTDSIGLTESTAIAITAAPTDSAGVSDATPAILADLLAAEGWVLADNAVPSATLPGVDSGTLSEGAVGLQGSLSAADQGALTEALALVIDLTRTDSFIFNEAALASEFADKLVSDSAALAENATLTEQVLKAASDAAVLSELASVLSVDLITASDSFSITEALNVSAALAVTDLAALAETAGKLETLSINLSDALTLSEAVSIAATALATDAATLSELAAASEFATKSASDSFSISEMATLETSIFKAASDVLALSEASALANTLAAADSFTLTELLSQTSAALAAQDQHVASDTAAIAASLATLDAFSFEDIALLDDEAFVVILGAVVSLALTLQGAAGASADVTGAATGKHDALASGASGVAVDVPGTSAVTVD
jgi:hypothetical protein